MKPKLKLFVWKDVLRDWNAGIAFALATTAEEAKQKVLEAGLYEYDEYYWDKDSKTTIDGVEPEVYEQAIGFFKWGGG